MTDPQQSLNINKDGLIESIHDAGIAGAGGAGFPSYEKWENISNVSGLLVNHQESEPNFYSDKWIGKEHASELSELFCYLLNNFFDIIVIGTKSKYRDTWMTELENQLDGSIYDVDDLPVTIENKSGIIFVYTPDVYTYSEETVLLRVTCGVDIGEDLPTDHGWIVHNTETLLNIYNAIKSETPVIRKFVHVDGETPHHRCLDVPIGTPATTLLEAAGLNNGMIDDDHILVDGGPGWCYKIDKQPEEFGVRKRTNAVLVVDEDIAVANMGDDEEIDIRSAYDWTDREHEIEPTTISPDLVRIPLITNSAYEGLVTPSDPVVNEGDEVSRGDIIAKPGEGISIPQHASINGVVSKVTGEHIVIKNSS